MVILIDAPLSDELAEQIQKLSPTIKLIRRQPFGGPIPNEELKEAEIIYTADANFDPADTPRLRWVQTNSAATNPIRQSLVCGSSIPIANVSGAYSVAVAECAIGMLLGLTRRITMGCRFQAERCWPEDYAPWAGDDLYGTTMGIVGYGSIGRQIARLASAMGMTILACKRRPEARRDDSYLLPGTGDPEGKLPRAWYGEKQLTEMLRQSDVAMITLPHVETTERLIRKEHLAALPRHAYLANVGRGAVIDEPALIDALSSGAIGGAALDVFAEEPLPPSSPLWTMPNVLIMPHIGSWTTMQATRASGVLIENINRDLEGRPLVNLIDKKLMY